MIEIDTTKNKQMVKTRLNDWIIELQSKITGNSKVLNYKVTIGGGRKYIRIVLTPFSKYCTQDTVFCFVRAVDGVILKPSSWKSPTLNFSRGSIFDTPQSFKNVVHIDDWNR